MNTPRIILIAMTIAIVGQVHAQLIIKDSLPPKKIPVQAFAAMPVLLGLDIENDFAHDRNYRTFTQNELTLPIQSSQVYTLHGSLPVIRKTKGFSAKLNFAYNVFKENIGSTSFNERVVLDGIEEIGNSAHLSVNVSKQILFKKWKKKLTLSGTFATSGKGFASLQKKTNKGIFSATLPLKMTPNQMFLIGAVGIVGNNIDKPLLPVVAYFGRLGPHLNAELIFPISAQFRYVFSNKGSLMIGSRIGTRTPFLDREIPIIQATDDALEFKSQNLRFYLNAEKALNKMVWINAEIGYNRNIKAALVTSNIDIRNRIFVGEDFGYGYVKIGVFIRPVFGSRNGVRN